MNLYFLKAFVIALREEYIKINLCKDVLLKRELFS